MNYNSKEELLKKYFSIISCDPSTIFKVSNTAKGSIKNNYFGFMERKAFNVLKRVRWIGDKYV